MKKLFRIPLIIVGGILVLIGIIWWSYGWFGGTIDVINYEAAEISRIEMSRSVVDDRRIIITEPEDIEKVINNVNSFQYTGNSLKNLFQFQLFMSGSVLYEIALYPKEEDPFILCFANSSNDESPNIDMSYWFYHENKTPIITNTCSGALDWYNDLYEKYNSSLN